jgi:hypothetical protein
MHHVAGMRALAVCGVLAITLTACDGTTGSSSSVSDQDLVVRYCEYGSVSQEQLNGCIEHVSSGDVEGRDTNAARYARGEIDSCRSDAGPFCGQ